MIEAYASGSWQVKTGAEEQFIERWNEFLQWTRKEHPGLISARLLRLEADPSHFVSMAEWDSPQSRTAWQNSEGFVPRFAACRQLCDEFLGGSYSLAAAV